MMHQPSGGIGGTASDIKIQAEQILHMKKQMAELTAEQTGQTLEQIELGQRPRQLVHGRGGLAYGFFDHISTHAGQAPWRRRHPSLTHPPYTAVWSNQ